MKTMTYEPDEILTIFHMNHSGLIKSMRDSDHNTSDHLNPYHMEGDVWSHTMSVFTAAVSKNAPVEVLLAALLHDVGKPQAREIKFSAERGFFSRFSGHEGLSFYIAIDVLQSFPRLTAEQVSTILELIASHSHLFDINQKESPEQMYAGRQEFYDMLVMLVECDTQGRVSRADCRVKSLSALETLKTVKVNEFELLERPTMILMVGPPGSGKSSFTEHAGENYTVVSRDDIVMELGAKDSYNESWSACDQKLVDQTFTKRLNDAVISGNNIVVDKCHMSKKSRREAVAAAKSKGYNVKCIVMATSINILLNRNEHRNKKIKPDVILAMMKSFYFPTAVETDFVVVVF